MAEWRDWHHLVGLDALRAIGESLAGFQPVVEEVTPGTILGKALESMDDGAGIIRVLVMLR